MPAPTPQPTGRDATARRILAAAVVLVSVACLAGVLNLIRTYGVNLFYWDQWDLMAPLFTDAPPWQWFTLQHGPHRQGVGGLLTWAVGSATRFDGRAEGYLSAACMAVALALALAAKWRLCGGPRWIDLFLPVLFLTPYHAHHFVNIPNNAHSATPLVLLFAMALLLTLPRGPWRDGAIACLGPACAYTGFALFAAPLAAAMLALEARHARIDGDRAGARRAGGLAVASGLAAATFFIGYVPDTANPTLRAAAPGDYLLFVGELFGRQLRVGGPTGLIVLRALGFVLFAAVTTATAWAILALLQDGAAADDDRRRRRRVAEVIALLGTFMLMYAVGCAIGRTTVAGDGARNLRYFALLVPGLFALAIAAEHLPAKLLRHGALALLAALLAQGAAHAHFRDQRTAAYFRQLKLDWAAAYDRTGNIARATQESGVRLHPLLLQEREAFERRWGFLRHRRLNYFKEGSGR